MPGEICLANFQTRDRGSLIGSGNLGSGRELMKLSKLEKHMRDHGCHFDHHGGNHDFWVNPKTGQPAPVPRHKAVNKFTALGICKSLGIPIPPGS